MTELETHILKNALSTKVHEKDEDAKEPSAKRAKRSSSEEEMKERLETRLISVLSCVICFDLPSGSIYQVCFRFDVIIIITKIIV